MRALPALLPALALAASLPLASSSAQGQGECPTAFYLCTGPLAAPTPAQIAAACQSPLWGQLPHAFTLAHRACQSGDFLKAQTLLIAGISRAYPADATAAEIITLTGPVNQLAELLMVQNRRQPVPTPPTFQAPQPLAEEPLPQAQPPAPQSTLTSPSQEEGDGAVRIGGE